MLALLGARHAQPGSRQALLLVVGLVGAALLYISAHRISETAPVTATGLGSPPGLAARTASLRA
jgi:hypothetical protein